MALQDLTPQLRTRLSRVERAVGVFVMVATLFLVAGFAYYLHHKAQRNGWFLTKVPYYTYTDSASGLKVGDPVTLMGFAVGEITKITPMPPDSDEEVRIEFVIRDPEYTYLKTEGSFARVTAQDFLGKRSIEATKGTNGVPTYLSHVRTEITLADAQALPKDNPYLLAENIATPEGERVVRALKPVTAELTAKLQQLRIQSIRVFDVGTSNKTPTFVWDDQTGRYVPFDIKDPTNKYLLPPRESPALTEVLEKITTKVDEALPGIFNLTNQISAVLTNSTRMVTNANELISQIKPVVAEAKDLLAGMRPSITNLNGIMSNLNNTNGALGEWLIPKDVHAGLQVALSNANATLVTANLTLTNVDTNLVVLVESLNRSLENLAGITSNLNAQVQVNTNILSNISAAIVHSDDLIQGLKRHWLLRSAFKTNKPPEKASPPRSR